MNNIELPAPGDYQAPSEFGIYESKFKYKRGMAGTSLSFKGNNDVAANSKAFPIKRSESVNDNYHTSPSTVADSAPFQSRDMRTLNSSYK